MAFLYFGVIILALIASHPIRYMRELRFCNDFCMRMYFGVRNVSSLKEVEEKADDGEDIEQGYDLQYGD